MNGQRECGTCTLCCKLIKVPTLNKPAGVQCKHCTGHSCEIYGQKSRPIACRFYKCLWLTDLTLQEELRPDRCHAIFEPVDRRTLVAIVDPAYPNSWKEEPTQTKILNALQHGYAIAVGVGTTKHVILPDNRSVQSVWDAIGKSVREEEKRCRRLYMAQI